MLKSTATKYFNILLLNKKKCSHLLGQKRNTVGVITIVTININSIFDAKKITNDYR